MNLSNSGKGNLKFINNFFIIQRDTVLQNLHHPHKTHWQRTANSSYVIASKHQNYVSFIQHTLFVVYLTTLSIV
jgi:hypothetical protein